ncbi:hypothetical protein [Chitinophaga pinensis]|uniref:Uncharacterized protein n=1 Tax=Chitinophaga pinensis (strain ATCC 43595 / DSM 2588 / LMG 13176 / NBRC 15968 / NCIMB 11800 / UQM 2034) TaxID=485918 RepID=A0A979G5Y9_CHIPD|nr:hypothetical protein [Chitinophaga pinensis]ACU61298.1 hypothetical protein Cpin_3836 [Chitinophaga pinensis DSM 2588]
MPEQKMTYQERKMKLAFNFDDMENADEYDAAAFTIEKQVEAIREFAKSEGFHLEPIEIWLLEHGYIDPKTATHE